MHLTQGIEGLGELMAEDIPTPPRIDESKPEVAAADWLLANDQANDPNLGKPPSAGATPAADDVFDLADGSSSDWIEVNPDQMPAGPSKPRQARHRQGEPAADPALLVPETWSRTREWGPNLIVLAAWAGVLALVVYFALGQGLLSLALLTFLVGLGVGAVLSYPILITLERPVRMTPEQAVRDYYAALSHHVPHVRRMWLLLSAAGRISYSFGSYEGFKAYWRERMAELRSGRAGPLTPLVFEVSEFKSEKSAGKADIDAQFLVKVSIRGQRGQGPIHTIPCHISLVRGPDKMWYLENGLLPNT